MKALIWFLTILAATMLNVLLGYVTGLKIGYFVFYLAVNSVAKRLCRAWDVHQQDKKRKDNAFDNLELEKNDQLLIKRNGESNVKDEQNVETTHPIAIISQEICSILFCRKCGFKLVENSDFCSKCGTAVVKERCK